MLDSNFAAYSVSQLSRKEGIAMPEIFVEKKGEKKWHALRGGVTVATGTTQNECGCKAKKKHPKETIMTARVEHAKHGTPGHWRRLYPSC